MEQQTKQNQFEEEISLAEIIKILWKRKLLIILLPIIAAIIAYTASQFMTPTYNSSIKLSLGNLGHQMYTNADAAEQVILSRDLLLPIIDELDLEFVRVRDFRNTISVKKLPASMVEIEVSYHDPDIAQQIAAKLAEEFIKKSEPIFLEKRALIEQRYESTFKQYEKVGESLARNKEAITNIETNPELTNAEKDLSRARLIDYLTKDEILFNNLESSLQSQQLQLLDIEKAEVFQQPTIPHGPSSPRPMLNTAIAVVVGGMIAVGIAFLSAYLKANPIRLEEDQAS